MIVRKQCEAMEPLSKDQVINLLKDEEELECIVNDGKDIGLK